MPPLRCCAAASLLVPKTPCLWLQPVQCNRLLARRRAFRRDKLSIAIWIRYLRTNPLMALFRRRLCSRHLVSFNSADLAAQPASEGVFQFRLRAAAIEIIDGLPFFIEWNKAAREVLIPLFIGKQNSPTGTDCTDEAERGHTGLDNWVSLRR